MGPSYQYAGLQNVRQVGLTVKACASRLHHLAYAEERLMLLQTAHLVPIPEWDLKKLLGRCQFEDAQHSNQLKERLPQLRYSKKKAYEPPDSSLNLVFDEALHSANTVELLAGLTRVFKPALLAAYRKYLADTNGLVDYPSVRAIRQIIAEEEEALELLTEVYDDTVDTPEKKAEADIWVEMLGAMLTAAGGIDGTGEQIPTLLKRVRSMTTYTIPKHVARDDTFPKVWDYIHYENEQVAERLAEMVATRLSEMTAVEGLAFVLYETKNQPWSFYMDISRHLWDELRHSMFGEVAVEDIFGDRSAMPIRECDAAYIIELPVKDWYVALGIGVEAALMKYPPGKRDEYEFCRDVAQYPLMANFQDFDWADEVLHVQIANRQLKDWFDGAQQELIELAQKGVDDRVEIRNRQPASTLPDVSHVLGQANKV